ncbi:MAG TPA: MauE/DoxX family redox-associated membrane protein [Candidatus Polarisedimenticolaceae bacterium]|nr:MauE/DoxX family redox-associated membrane protein [Candidatus Polarisedimenticolaceae bacterium]
MAALDFVRHPTVRRIAQLGAGVIFIAAALPKIADLEAFAGSIHNFHMDPVVPMALTNILAVTIPWIELIAGLALIANVKPRAGAVVYTVLMTFFTVAVIAALARGLSFDCGCFGKSGAANLGAVKLLENVGMLVLGIVASLERRG